MLIEFKVSNYRSFKSEQIFSMETGKKLSKFKDTNTINLGKSNVLKSSLMFGANANGKSNLIMALYTMKSLVLKPTNDELQNLPHDTFGYNNDDTMFSINFIQEKNNYKYKIKFNESEITEETLSINDSPVFIRKKQTFIKVPNKMSSLTDNIRKNQLLLYYSQQNNEENSKKVYKWFADNLIFVDTEKIINTKFKLLEDPKFKDNFLSFLQAADFNIIDIDVKEKVIDKFPLKSFLDKLRELNNDDDEINLNIPSNFNPRKIYDVYSTHKSEEKTFNVFFDNESTGTKVFMILALYILSNSEKTLIIDEFDRSYHLELAKALLCLINSKDQNNQFILTTHSLSLMNHDLRQDQIWFAEKNQFGESQLFSLFDFDDPKLTRHDANYKKRYLEGRYGATQIIDENLLLEALKDSE